MYNRTVRCTVAHSSKILPLRRDFHRGVFHLLDAEDEIPHVADERADPALAFIAGFEMTEPGIARDGFHVYVGGEKVGVVTSASPAPFLKKNIGLAFLPPDLAKIGQEIRIDVRGKQLAAVVVPTPFYKRQK